jgi:hypothetical protein
MSLSILKVAELHLDSDPPQIHIRRAKREADRYAPTPSARTLLHASFDLRSPERPCASYDFTSIRIVKETFTPELSKMLSTRKIGPSPGAARLGVVGLLWAVAITGGAPRTREVGSAAAAWPLDQ